MKKLTTTALVSLMGLFFALPAGATVPELIPVQGMLTDADDAPVDGATDLRFAFFDTATGGTELWFTELDDYDIEAGFFSVYLGENKPLDVGALLGASELWLEITAGTDVLDRIRMASVLFALQAGTCSEVGDMSPGEIQPLLSGSCSVGEFVYQIDPSTGDFGCGTVGYAEEAGTCEQVGELSEDEIQPLLTGWCGSDEFVKSITPSTGTFSCAEPQFLRAWSSGDYTTVTPDWIRFQTHVAFGRGVADGGDQQQLRVASYEREYAIKVEGDRDNDHPERNSYAIHAESTDTGDGYNYAVYAEAANSSGYNYGVYSKAEGANSAALMAKGKAFITDVTGSGTVDLCQNSSSGEIGTCSSSEKFKDGVSDLEMGLETVMSLRPVSYKWKDDGMEDIGFVAEEAAEVNPLLVIRNPKGEVHGVRYRQYTAVLTNAIKQQQEQIEALKKLVCKDNPDAPVCQ